MRKASVEVMVGGFVLLGIAALIMLALQVSGLSGYNLKDSYELKARFDNIGGLKVRSPVKMGGVVIGRVSAIDLDTEWFMPVVTLQIDKKYQVLPTETSARIMTAGLLGEQFIGLSAGGDDEVLVDGDSIRNTQSALVLEELISHFVFGQKN